MITPRASRKLSDMIEAELQPTEQIEDLVFGQGLDGDDIGGPALAIALTDRRVIAVARGTVSRTCVSWNHEQITAIGTGKGLLKSSLDFTVPGDQFIGKGIAKADAQRFRRAVEQRLVASKNQPSGSSSPSSGDARNRLEELTSLREAGLITQDEYDSKRLEVVQTL